MKANAAAPAALLSTPAPSCTAFGHPHTPKALRLREARSCYNHLAGRLGVALADALESQGLILQAVPGSYVLTAAGHEGLIGFGLDIPALRPSRQGLVRPCLDWTERRPHLAGPLANSLLSHLLKLGWVRRGDESRALVVTPEGRHGLQAVFGMSID